MQKSRRAGTPAACFLVGGVQHQWPRKQRVQLVCQNYKSIGHIAYSQCWRCLHCQAFEHTHLHTTKIVMSMLRGYCVLEGSKFQPKNREQFGCMEETRLKLAFTAHSLSGMDYPYNQLIVTYKAPKQEELYRDWESFCKPVSTCFILTHLRVSSAGGNCI